MNNELTEFKFTPSSHYPDKLLLSPTHSGAYGMKGTSILTKEAWYDPMIHGYDTNKIAGITFDKRITINTSGIWSHRESMRLGWIPSTRMYKFMLFLFMHVNGRPYIPKPYSEVLVGQVSADEPFDWELKALEKVTTAWYKQYDNAQQTSSLKTFTPGPGYVLGPYHGGKKWPLNKYSLFTKAELLYPV